MFLAGQQGKLLPRAEEAELSPLGTSSTSSMDWSSQMKARKLSDKDIDKLAARSVDDFLRRSSIAYLECCVSLMLTHLDRDQVARVLEAEAAMVRELG